MTASLVYAVNGDSDNLFNEDDWKETVLNIDRTLYYAPHFTGDLFFNPWIEMDKVPSRVYSAPCRLYKYT